MSTLLQFALVGASVLLTLLFVWSGSRGKPRGKP